MNAGGQLAGLNFPNWTGFSGQVLNQGPDRDVNEIMIRAYNDWHIDEWCGAYPDRFIPCGMLPLFDVERAATRVFGDEAAAREWLGAPIPVLGGAIPIELLVTTPGHQAVMNALRRIMAGTAA